MKKFLIILFGLTLIVLARCGDDNPIAHNDDPMGIVFNTTVGGDGWEWGRDVVALPTSGYVLTGWTDSYGQGRNDLYLVRVDANGDVLWESNFGGTQNNSDDIGEGIALTPDGNIIATGVSNAFGSAYQRYIVKVDMDGNLIWETTIGEGTYESASKVFPVSDGYIVGGNEGIFIGDEYYLMKIDLDGNLVWDSVYTNTDKRFRCMTPTSDNGYILGGSYILKVDQNGVPQWTYNDFEVYSVIELTDGSIVISGRQNIAKLTSSGLLIWEKNLYGGYVVENNDGTLSICNNNIVTHEILIKTLNSGGNLLSSRGTGINGTPFMMIQGNMGYVITGVNYEDDQMGSAFIAELSTIKMR